MSSCRRVVLFGITCCLLTATTAVLATPPRSPIQLSLKVDGLEQGVLIGDVVVEVVSFEEAPGTTVSLILPPGMEADQTQWSIDLRPDVPVVLTTRWSLSAGTGNHTLSARASRAIGPKSSWGDMKSVTYHLEAAGVPATGWKVDRIPVARPARPGTALVVSEEPVVFSFEDRSDVSGRDESWPGTAAMPPIPPGSPESMETAPAGLPVAAGTVTLTGTWMYPDRSGVARPVDQQFIEIRKGDGTALSPRVFCFTQANGAFSCSFAHPGTTMRVWLRSATNLTPGPTRLGVFSGIEVPGGCGSDSMDCTYANTSAAVSCADGATCSLGVMTAAGGEPWIGAHQMTQDLIRSWKKILFDTQHPAGTHSGPAKITYPTPAGHGPHAHVFNEGSESSGDPWISIPAPFQTAADVIAHEYGHAVMDNIWQPFAPGWPTDDCPASHALGYPSGYGCALSEGFADYWSWYSNELYDGDDDPNNNGPVYDDPGFSSNFETRDDGEYRPGRNVEGNVAGAFGDMMDALNEGSATCSGGGDRLADGIQHVWHVFYSGRSADFLAWFNAYWSVYLHPRMPAMETSDFNMLDLGFPLNDTCAGATEIPAMTWADSIDTTLTSCVEPGEPSPTCGSGSNAHSVYYHWTAPGPGTVTVDTEFSEYDTILSVYAGACGALTSLYCNDDTPTTSQSKLIFTVSAGQSLTFMVSSYGSSGGVMSFHFDYQPSPATNDSCGAATVIAATPYSDARDVTPATGDPADPVVPCHDFWDSPTATVFYRWTAPADGTIHADTIGSNYHTTLTAYTGACGALALQACSDDVSQYAAEMTLPVTAGTVYTFMISADSFRDILVFHLDFAAVPPSHDGCPASKVASPPSYVDISNTVGASPSPGDPLPGCGNQSNGKNVWYQFTAPISGVLTVDTFGSSYDTILSAWTGACGSLSEVYGGCNDDFDGTTSRLQLAMTQGATYNFQVSAYHNDGGTLAFHSEFVPNAPFNDECIGANITGAPPWAETVYTVGATTSPGEPASPCGNGSAARSVWWRFTAPVSGALTIDTFGSDHDTILTAWSGGCGALVNEGCNDDSPGSSASLLTVPVDKGVTYHIRSAAYNGDGGSLHFSLQFAGDSGHVPDGSFYPGQPLEVAAAAGGQVHLTWGASCLATDDDYTVYEGRIGSYYSHLPVYCSTGGSRDVTFGAAPFDAYYIVAPRNGAQEGSHGLANTGAERVVEGLTCLGQGISECSPVCAHDICSVGAALDPACSDCVALICAGDPDCCASSWDADCADQAQRSCAQECL